MGEWKTLSVRIVVFLSGPGKSLPASAHYLSVWGVAPENAHQPQNNALAPTVAQGEKGDLILNCTTFPGRVDFVFSPKVTNLNPEQPELGLIHDDDLLRQEIDSLVQTIETRPITDQAARVGVVIQVCRPAANVSEANRHLSGKLPSGYTIPITDESDFILQLNYRSENDDSVRMIINRVTKWSVDQFHVMTFQLPQIGQVLPGGFPAIPHIQRAASVSFDYNTLPPEDNSALILNPAQQCAMLRQMVSEIYTQQKFYKLNSDSF